MENIDERVAIAMDSVIAASIKYFINCFKYDISSIFMGKILVFELLQ